MGKPTMDILSSVRENATHLVLQHFQRKKWVTLKEHLWEASLPSKGKNLNLLFCHEDFVRVVENMSSLCCFVKCFPFYFIYFFCLLTNFISFLFSIARGIVSMCNLRQNEATKTVKVTGIDTITVEDNGATIAITLWREHAEKQHQMGDFFKISHCLLSEWQGNWTLNSTWHTAVEVYFMFKLVNLFCVNKLICDTRTYCWALTVKLSRFFLNKCLVRGFLQMNNARYVKSNYYVQRGHRKENDKWTTCFT